ncbi:OPT oligopeptide transporter protein-domain-containing protein [Kickxella alabastrina]|uniref:OPT oligopeptide transporter protein-domain-containing protein n=1 Tax=Kickxella alabastrina TaxID=61397 RepID=UPI00221E8922|nr:OPT oligopeptide transporter protein-domain-containing protein [Kickxella alabastrina]KAI7823102.1 OPT oligopeptide transporter protein-domain-containing protein [Kickxella alabastrina]
MSRTLPTRKFHTFGWEWTMNPGAFNIKEHVLVSIFATASSGSPYAIDVVTIKKIWYKSDLGFIASLLFILTSQMMGYSFAGLTRKFLVYPAAMIWPSTLISVTLFRTFHEIQNFGSRMTRTKMFWMCFTISFFWYFVPNFIAPALSYIAIMCYIAPNNVIVHQLSDAYNGLGVMNFTLDWSTISSNMGSPIAYPWAMACNLFTGFVILMWIITPIGYYTNTWGTGNLPIYTAHLYKINGSAYDISQIMTLDQNLDEAKYAEYGPVRMTFQFAISYGIGFAAIITLLVYIGLHYGPEIYQRMRESRNMDEDVHMKMMRSYDEVPHWWYITLFVITFSTSIVVCEVYHMMPWYWVILSIIVPFVFTIPIGIITAISNQQPGLNIITEFIIGYGMPGNPIANVTFKVYGYITMVQALNLVGDLKLGHYMKIPPRHMFIVQLAGTLLASFIELAVAYWLMNSVKNICTPEGYPFTCISANTFYSASVLWGLIGPGKLLGHPAPTTQCSTCFLSVPCSPSPYGTFNGDIPEAPGTDILVDSQIVPRMIPRNMLEHTLKRFCLNTTKSALIVILRKPMLIIEHIVVYGSSRRVSTIATVVYAAALNATASHVDAADATAATTTAVAVATRPSPRVKPICVG